MCDACNMTPEGREYQELFKTPSEVYVGDPVVNEPQSNIPAQLVQHVCPTCGRCPTCGQPWQNPWYWPYRPITYWPGPYWYDQPMCSSTTTTVTF
jgi:hypothetical protein